MPDSLETAALNGSLFSFDDSPPSPIRSISSDTPLNTDDELGSDLESDNNQDNNNKIGKRGDISGKGVPPISSNQNINVEHDGPQTGPKGVIEDRKAHNSFQKQKREKELNDTIIEQNRKAIIGLTIHEEDLLRKQEQEQDELEEWRKKRKDQLIRNQYNHNNEDEDDEDQYKYEDRRQSIKRGGLREIGKENFIEAVERPGWVVVLIYEPDIPRCTSLIASLLHLSLNLPSSSNLPIPITLFKARATSLQFSLLPPSSSNANSHTKYEDEEPLGKPDSDVLPTMLLYKGGDLEKTWIRVDWEVDESGVEGLLKKEGILPSNTKTSLNRRNLIDDDNDNNDDD
ncbi:uncharacterized protein L201_007276 [Kwoniella dendrophila CBS 6074]|uniref:Phosducin domain-containing protein n=1 Tax=Kwoniella dendrophila CBS 6074 TaxID=1295534 RepID=A0AAX4K636_9TREE